MVPAVGQKQTKKRCGRMKALCDTFRNEINKNKQTFIARCRFDDFLFQFLPPKTGAHLKGAGCKAKTNINEFSRASYLLNTHVFS